MNNYYKADEGKVWRNKETKMIMGGDIYIGFIFPNGVKTQDSISNYEQVDKPEEQDLPLKIK